MTQNNSRAITFLLVPLILVFALTYVLGGCKPASKSFFERLKYMKDPRTNLCFAVLVRPNNEPKAFTQVPCTLAVMKEIDK